MIQKVRISVNRIEDPRYLNTKDYKSFEADRLHFIQPR